MNDQIKEIIDALEDLLTDCIVDSDNGTMVWTNEGRQKAATILHHYFPTTQIDIEEKYLIALRWFRLFYRFFQKDIKDKPSAAMSAMSKDSELKELLREVERNLNKNDG